MDLSNYVINIRPEKEYVCRDVELKVKKYLEAPEEVMGHICGYELNTAQMQDKESLIWKQRNTMEADLKIMTHL